MLEEPRGRYKSAKAHLARPSSTKEVSELLKFCNAHSVGVVPFGGGTGLVGGQISPDQEVVLLSLEKMDAIGEIDRIGRRMRVGAGAILENIHTAAASEGLRFPISLASQGSAQIGGNLATNAGGINVVRYGMARDLCAGLEVVLPDGTILDDLRGLPKDNAGYNLRHLFIGSEGTLGVVTQAMLKLYPAPRESVTLMLEVEGPSQALRLFEAMSKLLPETIEAFEIMNILGLRLVKEYFPALRQAFDPLPEWSLLLELSSLLEIGLEERVLNALSEWDGAYFKRAFMANSKAQRQEFWALREHIPLANRKLGAISNHDISVPPAQIANFIAKAEAALSKIGSFQTGAFGHLGDGNLHYNVFPLEAQRRSFDLGKRADIKNSIHELVHQLGGSIAAEHGIGRLKTDDLKRFSDPGKFKTMRDIKGIIDPKGIMNPRVLFA